MTEQPIRVIVDYREKSEVPKILDRLGAELVYQKLPCADYVVSDKVGFEYKSIEDFLMSEVGEEKMKLNRQIHDLVEGYAKPALLIGGTLADLLTRRNIHENSVTAFLQAILWQGCAIRFLNTPEVAANYIYATAKKEQVGGKRDFCYHGGKTKRTPAETSEYIISSIPDIGGTLAKALLNHCGSVEAVITAPIETLVEVKGIETPTALHIRNVASAIYFGGK